MWVYGILLLLPLGWLAAASAAGARGSRVAAFAIAAFLTLFIGLRYKVGGDWHAYWLMFERAQSHPPVEALALGDAAYMALNLLAGRLGLSLAFVNLACAALVAAGVIAFASRQPRPWLALLAATPVLILVAAMTTTRQSAAIGLELLALTWLSNGRRAAPTAALLLAFGFHWSAIVLLPIVPLLFLRQTWQRPLRWGLAAVAGAIVVQSWISELSWVIYEPAIGAGVRLAPSALAAAVALLLLRRRLLPDREARIAVYLAGLTILCLALLPVAGTPADRLGLYTIPLQMLVLPRAIDAMTGRLRRPAEAALAGIYVLLFVAWAGFSSYADCMVPYRSYLERPAWLLGSNPVEPGC